MNIPRGIGLFIFCACLSAHAFAARSQEKWQQTKGQNFIIYSREVPQDFVDTVMASAEEEFRNVTSGLGITRYQSWAWDKRAVIYIYRDNEDYVESGGQAGWSHGAALVQEKVIKTYPSANGFFDSMLPHELGHIILHEFTGPYADIPLWFDEGTAMYQEKARRLGSDSEVRAAIEKGAFIPLTQLKDVRIYNGTDEDTVHLFYAEAASAVHFLITEFGDQHFYKLCRALKDHMRFEDALSETYVHIKGLEDLNKQWLKHLQGG